MQHTVYVAHHDNTIQHQTNNSPIRDKMVNSQNTEHQSSLVNLNTLSLQNSNAQTAANLTTSPQNPASHPTQIQNTTSPLQQHQQQPNQQHQQIIDQQRQRAIQFNTMRYHNHINNTAGVQQNNYHLLPQNTLNQQTANASKIQQISPMVNGSATGVPTQQPQSGGQY